MIDKCRICGGSLSQEPLAVDESENAHSACLEIEQDASLDKCDKAMRQLEKAAGNWVPSQATTMTTEDRNFAAAAISKRWRVRLTGISQEQIGRLSDVVWPKCEATIPDPRTLSSPIMQDDYDGLVGACQYEVEHSQIYAEIAGSLSVIFIFIIKFIVSLLIDYFLNKKNYVVTS